MAGRSLQTDVMKVEVHYHQIEYDTNHTNHGVHHCTKAAIVKLFNDEYITLEPSRSYDISKSEEEESWVNKSGQIMTT